MDTLVSAPRTIAKALGIGRGERLGVLWLAGDTGSDGVVGFRSWDAGRMRLSVLSNVITHQKGSQLKANCGSNG